MKKVIFILLALMLLGGGGAGGYFFFQEKKEDVVEAPKEPTVPLVEYIDMEPLSLPVIRGGKVRRLLTFRLTIELTPTGSFAQVWPSMPRLADAALTQLASLAALDWPEGAILDADVAKRRMLQQFQQIVPGNIIAHVLIKEVFDRPV